jgi:ferric-dicitrate binding protein FerR (iron transport regulator)
MNTFVTITPNATTRASITGYCFLLAIKVPLQETQPGAVALSEFNRYNRKRKLVIDDDSLHDQRYGGTFEADEPLALIEFLRGTPGLTVQDEGDRLVIRRQ